MILSVTALVVTICVFNKLFMGMASTNYIINGIIIGTSIFGIALCFHEMLRLAPEYKWLNKYINGHRNAKLPPRTLRPVATVLQQRPCRIYSDTLSGMMDMIANRFNNARESIRYITSTLIFLGLLGTFWGLLVTLGGFGELLYGIDVNEENIMTSIQYGLSGPLSGMATAFTCSILGLGASLINGFLGRIVELAHNLIYTELGDYMAAHTHIVSPEIPDEILPKIDLNNKTITKTGIKHKRQNNK